MDHISSIMYLWGQSTRKSKTMLLFIGSVSEVGHFLLEWFSGFTKFKHMIFIQILTNKTTLNLVLQQSLKKIIEQPIF